MNLLARTLVPLLAFAMLAATRPARALQEPHESAAVLQPGVELTWMSVANWYFKFGDLRIMMDGYFTRLPGPPFFFGGGGGLKNTTAAFPVNLPSIIRVSEALDAGGSLDYLIAGHSHFDHTFDTATWSALTHAPIIGGLSTCLQAQAEGLPASQCINVKGGERLRLSTDVVMYVVRWNHSGSHASNPEQHDPVELKAAPIPNHLNGGLRGGVAEDFPNGGGGRMYLFTIGQGTGRLSFFVNDSASADDLTRDIVVDGVNYGAPLANLKKAMDAAGLYSVDLWIGTGSLGVAQLVVPVLRPRAYIPNHWDGIFNPFFPGLPFPYQDSRLQAYLAAQNIPIHPQTQYFDKFLLDSNGVTKVLNTAQKRKLGFKDVQFPASAPLRSAAVRATSPEECQ